jgi:signal transduction histidine kinase
MRFISRAWNSQSFRGVWISLVPVVAAFLALLMLAGGPLTASWVLGRVRLRTSETLAPARQLVRDIAASVAIEAAMPKPTDARSTPDLGRRYAEAVATEHARDSALGALSPRLNGEIAEDVGELRSLTAQWHAARNGDPTAADVKATDVLASAARLDSSLAQGMAVQIARVRSLEEMDVVLPSVLVPLLAIVLFAIYWTGRRMAALADEAEQSRLALAMASERKVTLLRGLTHDLKNSLGAAAGFTMLLREEATGPLTDKQRDYVTRIGRIIDQTVTSVGDTLTIARTEAAALPVRRRKEDVRTLVLESAADYVAAAEHAGLTLSVEFAEDLPPVETDPSLVSKIIGNLLSNAIKYTPAGGRIWLRAFSRLRGDMPETGPWLAAEVCDTGPGVPAAFREQVFDEFFRTPTATSTTGGDGIGLAMSRRVARLLGGDITLHSEEGRGATFTLWLPAQPRDAIPIADVHAATTHEERVATGGAPPQFHASGGGGGGYDRRRAVQ